MMEAFFQTRVPAGLLTSAGPLSLVIVVADGPHTKLSIPPSILVVGSEAWQAMAQRNITLDICSTSCA
jgi:hypothetical protein